MNLRAPGNRLPASGQYEWSRAVPADANYPCDTADAADEAGLSVQELAWYEGQSRAQDR